MHTTDLAAAHIAHVVEQEKNWRNLFLQCPLSLLVTNLQGDYLHANTHFIRLMGLSEFELRRLNLKDLARGSDIEIDDDALASLIREERGEIRVTKHQVIENKSTWINITVSLIKNDQGHAAKFMTLLEDVSEGRLAEIALRTSEERLRATVTYTHLGISLISLQGEFIDINPAFAFMLGRSCSECIGLNVQDVTHPDYIDETINHLKELIGGQVDHFRIIKKYLRKDKTWFWAQSTVSLAKGERGEPARVIAVTEDISERLRIEEGLRAAERRALFAAEAALIGSWDFDFGSRIFHLCDMARSILGIPRTDPISEAHLDRVHIEDRELLREQTIQAMAPDSDGRFESRFRVCLKPDEIIWVRALGQMYFIDRHGHRQVSRFTGVVMNVSDQVRLEEQLKSAMAAAEDASTAKSLFLANMSHEIRTPLGAILGYSELLKSKRGSPEENEVYLNTILRNGRALINIIDDILDLSKVEAGKLNFEEIEFDLHLMLTDLQSLFLERSREKGIPLRLEIDAGLPVRVRSDPTRLRQILINLVGNALKFTEKGHVDIIARGGPIDDAHSRITLSIRDTGIGLKPQQIAQLFRPFSQADNSTTRRFGGTGLGLSLSRYLAKALGGDISVSPNTEGPGCTFMVTVLVKNGQSTPERAEGPRLIDESHHSLAGVHVLLAEDAFDNQLLVSTILADQGAHVEIVQNGRDAMNKALEQNFDVVLMDLQMPVMDGYEATRCLRRAGYGKPIVALTAHAMSSERCRTMEAGCNGHLTKPINPMELIDTVGRYGLAH